MEDAIATKATSALNARLGDADGKLKELDIKWGIEYGILRDALDEVRKERDRYKEALERVCYCTDETGTCKCILLGREALGRKPFDDDGNCDLGM